MPNEELSPSKPKGCWSRVLSILLRIIVLHIVLTSFLLFAGIAAFSLILLFLSAKILRHRRRLRRLSSPETTRGLSREEMRRLLPCLFKCSQSLSDDCAVCLDGFGEGEWCRLLPGCGHLFHRRCVDRWLERSRACPICRGRVDAGRI